MNPTGSCTMLSGRQRKARLFRRASRLFTFRSLAFRCSVLAAVAAARRTSAATATVGSCRRRSATSRRSAANTGSAASSGIRHAAHCARPTPNLAVCLERRSANMTGIRTPDRAVHWRRGEARASAWTGIRDCARARPAKLAVRLNRRSANATGRTNST